MNAAVDSFGYPMNLSAYATRGIVWGQRKVLKQGLKGRVFVRSPEFNHFSADRFAGIVDEGLGLRRKGDVKTYE